MENHIDPVSQTPSWWFAVCSTISTNTMSNIFVSFWQPAACSSQPQARIFSTSLTSRSQVLPHSWQPEALPPLPPPKKTKLSPSRPALVLDPQSCLPPDSQQLAPHGHLQAALPEALQAVTNSFLRPGGQKSTLPPPKYFPPCLTTLYGPTDWKAAAWNLEGGNVHSVIYAPGPADTVTQDWRIS